MIRCAITHAATVLAGTCVAATAYAADWRLISPLIAQKKATFGDATSIRRSGNRVLLWTDTVDLMGAPDRFEIRVQWAVDCANNTSQLLAYIDYNRLGENKRSDSTPGSVSPTAPDTVGETLTKFACATTEERDSQFDAKVESPSESWINFLNKMSTPQTSGRVTPRKPKH